MTTLYDQQRHENQWWATYNAALTGLHAFISGVGTDDDGSVNLGYTTDTCHEVATVAANLAHGSCKPKTRKPRRVRTAAKAKAVQ